MKQEDKSIIEQIPKKLILTTLMIGLSLLGLIIYDQGKRNADSIIIHSSQETSDIQSKLITVHLEGAVRYPGVYRVSANLHLYEVINRTGGLLDNATVEDLNLAKIIKDGEKIVIPYTDRTLQQEEDKREDTIKRVSLNQAGFEELQQIPGVGPSTAQRIIDYRERIGKFRILDEIKRVKGIGPKTYMKIVKYISL